LILISLLLLPVWKNNDALNYKHISDYRQTGGSTEILYQLSIY